MKQQMTIVLFFYAIILCAFNPPPSAYSPYSFQNGSFEDLHPLLPNSSELDFFVTRRVGPSWFAHKGKPRVYINGGNAPVYTCGPCGNGSKFASLQYKNWNGKKKGSSMFMYYPMKAGETYNLKFDYRKNTEGTLYIIATNSATANYDVSSNLLEELENFNGNYYDGLPYYDQMLVTKVSQKTEPRWSGTSYAAPQSPNISFTPTQDFTQLLFIFHSPNNNERSEIYLDAVTMSGALNQSGKVKMVVNGKNADTHPGGITICSGDPVILDGRGTVDTSLDHNGRIQHFTSVYYFDANGNKHETTKWHDGVPSGKMNLQDHFQITVPDNSSRMYFVKLAINSGPTNTWIEKVMRVKVKGKPGFGFGNYLIAGLGELVSRKVVGLSPNTQYEYKWYEENSTQVLSTSDRVYIRKYTEGVYPYSVEVTDLSTGCTTKKTIEVNYVDTGSDEIDDSIGFKAYPNPVTGDLLIKSERRIDKIELYSLDGRRVKQSIENNLNVEGLRKGIYVLKVYSEGKIIKETKIVKD